MITKSCFGEVDSPGDVIDNASDGVASVKCGTWAANYLYPFHLAHINHAEPMVIWTAIRRYVIKAVPINQGEYSISRLPSNHRMAGICRTLSFDGYSNLFS